MIRNYGNIDMNITDTNIKLVVDGALYEAEKAQRITKGSLIGMYNSCIYMAELYENMPVNTNLRILDTINSLYPAYLSIVCEQKVTFENASKTLKQCITRADKKPLQAFDSMIKNAIWTINKCNSLMSAKEVVKITEITKYLSEIHLELFVALKSHVCSISQVNL